MGCKKGVPHRKWSKNEKLKLVKLHLDEHMSICEIEREYSVEHSLISKWVKKYLDEGEESLAPKVRPGNRFAALHKSKELTELERLRLTVAKQEIEIARLKKGYWVEGVGVNREYVTGSEKTTKSLKNSKENIR